MAQIPPPVHGAALRNKSLMESKVLNERFHIHPLPLRFVSEMKDLGHFSFRKIGLTISYTFRLLWILITQKTDLAYFTMSPFGGAFYRDILFISCLKLFRKKVLLHFRIKGIKKTSETKWGRRLIKYAFKNSDIICLSRNHMQDVEGFTFRTPFIVPNGIKVEPFLTELLHKYNDRNQNGNGLKILFLSNLSKTKGVYELLEALQILKKKGFDFQAEIVGDEATIGFEELRRMIEAAGLQKNVLVMGPRYGKEKFMMIADADIFVFPTYFELFPGVILEAMQFGKPIVTTFEGSIPEMIDNGKSGILVPQKDSVALAQAIETLIHDPEKRKRIAEEAQKKFFNEFTLEKFEHNMLEVFEKIIDSKTS
ncbi:MAG TPA: glycosyltransferase family 4 protein [Puia sp.]|nr:glycosyltransferase family 4 protein [Puia sp.]